jgi:hypothetical protein
MSIDAVVGLSGAALVLAPTVAYMLRQTKTRLYVAMWGSFVGTLAQCAALVLGNWYYLIALVGSILVTVFLMWELILWDHPVFREDDTSQ